jgi:lysyl-tRNA synthetase class 2
VTVSTAFARFAAIPAECLSSGEAEAFRLAARATGCRSIDDGDDWETVFHKLLLERVEPALAGLRGVHLTEYPAPLAALARLKSEDRRVAERFESYAGGLELANGFGELTDSRQQRRRFLAERIRRRQEGRDPLPLDEAFLRDLDSMPPASGVALGFDRLVMLATGSRSIADVIAF